MSESPSEAFVATLPSGRAIARPGVRLASIVLLFALASPSLASAQAPPIAAFTPSPDVGCTTPRTVFFDDRSTGATSWHWDFGDGGSSTAQNPIHSYVTAGDFLVTLTVANAAGSDEATATISISIPVADFSGTSLFGCGPLEASFTDESTSTTSLASWNWDFGDGTSSSARHPSHVYDSPGTYPVTLSVTDANGCSDQVMRTSFVQVIGPDPDFGADAVSGPVPHPVSFGNQTLAGAPIVSWAWSFGDGSASSQQHPDHTYSSAGVFDVSLTAADLDGCMRTVSKPELITVTAIADLSVTITDGVSAAVPGQTLTYTLVARNEDVTNDPAAVVTDDFPADLSCSWTSVAAGGASGNSDGSGDLLDILDLPPGSSVTYTAECAIGSAATGTLSNTAAVASSGDDAEPANDSATDDDTLLTPMADLAVTVTDGLVGALPGSPISVTLVATNAGPSSDLAAEVDLPFTAAVTGVSWTCLATPGSTCASAGSGDILDTLTLAPGGSATFTATGILDGSFLGPLTHTASIQPGPGVVDVAPDDNTASDVTIVAPESVLGIPALPRPALLVLALLLGAAACLRLRV